MLVHDDLITDGRHLRNLRLDRRLTQAQLAVAVGVTRSAVAQWETDRASFGSKLRLLAKALDVPVDMLMGETVSGHPVPASNGRLPTEVEVTLLRHFREVDEADQAFALRLLLRLAGRTGGNPYSAAAKRA
jgi:transcriptional regulator with XRE-family HTH domain